MKYYLKHFADRQFSHIEDPKARRKAAECRLVQLFFDEATQGYYVDVGASDPKDASQTWHLDQKGWRGILIEPIPELCENLRRHRPQAVVVQAACGAPEQRGQVEFHVADGFTRSTLEKNVLSQNVTFTRTDLVDLKTLDDILTEIDPPDLDFVSIDVEGLQLNVLRGFDLQKYKPSLLLIEDHMTSLKTHRYLRQNHYYLAKRTSRNNWYVPAGKAFKLTSPLERFVLWRKVWLHTPFRKLRTAWKASLRKRAASKKGGRNEQ